MKSPTSAIIEAPNTTSTSAVTPSLGTNVSVCSLTVVAAGCGATGGADQGTQLVSSRIAPQAQQASGVVEAAQTTGAVTTEKVGPNTMHFGFTQWPGTPKEVKGYDIFVFRDGKIVFQSTFATDMPKS